MLRMGAPRAAIQARRGTISDSSARAGTATTAVVPDRESLREERDLPLLA